MSVLTGAEMRELERVAAAADGENGPWHLMLRAGQGAAAYAAVRAAGRPVLVLAGPGNNGGDGYVMAAALQRHGVEVAVAAAAEPASDLCRRARREWDGPVAAANAAAPRPVLIDALFGTGLSRPLEERTLSDLMRLSAGADLVLAVDMPSGVGSSDGTLMPGAARCHETYALGALKPGHLLLPGSAHAGRLTVIPIGLPPASTNLMRNAAPGPPPALPSGAHKYDRGHVAVFAGAMPGAAYLAARAAQRGGAGFVTIAGAEAESAPPSSIVYAAADALELERVDALIVGPGLGSGAAAEEAAERALGSGRPLVVDGDMFSLLADHPERLRGKDAVLTPHEGEFARMFGEQAGSKVDRARAAADLADGVVVLKGRDTVIAAPGGRAAINDHAHPRLAVAGSGDILAGLVAAERARGRDAFDAACAAVWRHGDAGLRGPDGLIAEDLLDLL